MAVHLPIRHTRWKDRKDLLILNESSLATTKLCKYKFILGVPGEGTQCVESDEGYKSLIECEKACTSLALVMQWVNQPVGSVMIQKAHFFGGMRVREALKRLKANPSWDTALTVPNDIWKNAKFHNVAFRRLPPLSMAPVEVYSNFFIMLQVVSLYEDSLQFASATLRDDREIVLRAVSRNGFELKFASAALQDDREIVLRAVNQYGIALIYASATLQADREIVRVAVIQNGYALGYVSADLRNDREIMIIAVKQCGDELQYASYALRADREIVLRAINRNSHALRYASYELRADREIVMEAITRNGFVLQYASEELRADREIVMKAISQNRFALKFASATLQAEFPTRNINYHM